MDGASRSVHGPRTYMLSIENVQIIYSCRHTRSKYSHRYMTYLQYTNIIYIYICTYLHTGICTYIHTYIDSKYAQSACLCAYRGCVGVSSPEWALLHSRKLLGCIRFSYGCKSDPSIFCKGSVKIPAKSVFKTILISSRSHHFSLFLFFSECSLLAQSFDWQPYSFEHFMGSIPFMFSWWLMSTIALMLCKVVKRVNLAKLDIPNSDPKTWSCHASRHDSAVFPGWSVWITHTEIQGWVVGSFSACEVPSIWSAAQGHLLMWHSSMSWSFW